MDVTWNGFQLTHKDQTKFILNSNLVVHQNKADLKGIFRPIPSKDQQFHPQSHFFLDCESAAQKDDSTLRALTGLINSKDSLLLWLTDIISISPAEVYISPSVFLKIVGEVRLKQTLLVVTCLGLIFPSVLRSSNFSSVIWGIYYLALSLLLFLV